MKPGLYCSGEFRSVLMEMRFSVYVSYVAGIIDTLRLCINVSIRCLGRI